MGNGLDERRYRDQFGRKPLIWEDNASPYADFWKGCANLRVLQRIMRILKNSDFEAKIKGVNSVSGVKMHDFLYNLPS